MTELKPCPFCGGEARLWHPKEYGITLGSVKCNSCGGSTESFTDDDSAIEAWNNRPSPWHTGTPTEDGLYILHCSNGIDDYHFNKLKNGNWRFHWLGKLIAWKKIEPYEEKEK